jgi:hypothetical protein
MFKILLKNVSTFHPHPDTLHKAEFKSTGLFDMVEEISWQIRVQAVA